MEDWSRYQHEIVNLIKSASSALLEVRHWQLRYSKNLMQGSRFDSRGFLKNT
jgi:hypothetical protein